MEKLSKALFWGGIIYFIAMVLVNMESTFHFNATQYVAEGEDREPIRIAQIIRDVVEPAFEAGVLITFSYFSKYFSTNEEI